MENLQYLSKLHLDNTKVSSADDIIMLAGLKEISIKNTPLFQNEEEVKKFIDAFPDAQIYIK